MSTSVYARTRSPSLSAAGRNRINDINAILRRNPMAFMTRDPNAVVADFKVCSEAGCTNTTKTATFNSMTMRTGLSYCTEHVKMDEVMQRIRTAIGIENMTLIFYDVELSRDGEIEQIGARSSTGEDFNAIIRTSVRTNSSPLLKTIPPEIWNILVTEPRRAMECFIRWTRAIHSRTTGGDTDVSKIMIAAHFGSCHDHVHLVRTMMKWGLTPPNYLLVDTLAIFKVMKGMKQIANLKTLVNTYAAWFDHTPHDADSDSSALRYVTMIAFPNSKLASYAFGISCMDFMGRSGLSLYVPSPMIRFSYRVRDADPERRSSMTTSEISLESRNSI